MTVTASQRWFTSSYSSALLSSSTACPIVAVSFAVFGSLNDRTVTLCATFQFDGVKVSRLGDDFTSALLLLSVITTSEEGCASSFTV